MAETIKGMVKRIRYQNRETGFVIFVIREIEDIVCKGVSGKITEGDCVEMEGNWIDDPVYGEQFKFLRIEVHAPERREDLIAYLSRNVKGVGEKTAEKIVDFFGEKASDVILNKPEEILKVKGLRKNAAQEAVKELSKNKKEKTDALFFIKYGISNGAKNKILKKYSMEELKELIKINPYELADTIKGIGFVQADKIAYQSGIKKDSVFRIKSGVLYAMEQVKALGHVYVPDSLLAEKTAAMLGVGEGKIQEGIESLLEENRLIEEDGKIYLPLNYRTEIKIAKNLVRLSKGLKKADPEKIRKAEHHTGISLDEGQKRAVEGVASQYVSIITGGPGTGKTTVIKVIIKYFEESGKEVFMAAPTGKASKRMTAAVRGVTKTEASTIHRMLGVVPEEDGGFHYTYNEDEPLPCDVLIVDEVSMIDEMLMNSLLCAIKKGTVLILVGDVDQLPSVGIGNVLKDCIGSGMLPVFHLSQIHRQGEGSAIIENAHKINRNEDIDFYHPRNDFFVLKDEEEDRVIQKLVYLVRDVFPKKIKNGEWQKTQVLVPIKKGKLGTDNLNAVLQEALNPKSSAKGEIKSDNVTYRVGDKVIHTKNNYRMPWRKMQDGRVYKEGLGVFNGDTGIITDITKTNVTVMFDDGKEVSYQSDDLRELMLSYALTIHKSQGSEYPVVVIPIVKGGTPELYNKNLLYTGVTRAKDSCCLIGSQVTITRMIHNNTVRKRYTTLKERIQEAAV